MIVVGLVVSGVLALLLGALSLPQWRRIQETRFFVAAIIGISLWAFGIASFLSASSEEVLLVSAILYYSAAALICLSTLLLGLTIYNKRRPALKTTLLLSTPFFAWAACLVLAPHSFLPEVIVAEQNTAVLNPGLYIWYIIYFLVYFTAALIYLRRAALRTKLRMRTRLNYLFWAYAISGAIGMTFNLILPGFGDYTLIWAGPFGILVFVPVIYVAIIRYGLFDVRETVSRTLAYILTMASLAAIYVTALSALSAWVLADRLNTADYGINVVVMLALVFVFQPIKRFFDAITNKIFYRHQYRREQFYRQVNAILTETTKLGELLRRVTHLIASTLNAKQVFVSVYRGDKLTTIGTQRHAIIPAKELRWLDDAVRATGRTLLSREELELTDQRELSRFMISYRIAMALPLRQGEDIIGYVFLGEHRGHGYTRRDRGVLETIIDELAIATQNALSVEEVRELNATLQQRVDEATSELRRSNAQLRKLDEAKDEFISMASHQLRTPLTSIKGYVDMMLEGDAGEVTPMQKKFLTEAFVSSERMVHLINDFLNVSRLQTGKFMIDKRPSRLDKVVQQEIDSLKINASGRSLTFDLKVEKGIPPLMLDEAKVRQVIMNFADNALYYSKEGTTIKIRLGVESDQVVFTVKDTGIGVPEDEQSKLFTKFFRAANARKHRPDGTGVGLYLAKRVITQHGGTIIFASEEDKGSTFGFSLPIERLRVRDGADKLEDEPADY